MKKEEIEFKVGDIVKINPNTPLYKIIENSWHGCQSWTLDFIKKYETSNVEFEVVNVDCTGDLELKGIFDFSDTQMTINKNIFKLVRRELLDKEEKKYLRAVIKPFRDGVMTIYKEKASFKDKEEILINTFIDGCGKITHLPPFDKNTMYKGMKLNRHYTLEDLGL